jgi:hypothetical protein
MREEVYRKTKAERERGCKIERYEMRKRAQNRAEGY